MIFCREARQREAQQSIPQQRQGQSGFPFLRQVSGRPKRLETFERCHAHLNKSQDIFVSCFVISAAWRIFDSVSSAQSSGAQTIVGF